MFVALCRILSHCTTKKRPQGSADSALRYRTSTHEAQPRLAVAPSTARVWASTLNRADLGRSMLRPYASQFQEANCSRRAIFLNLPTELRGISLTKTKASCACHLAKDLARKSRSSCAVERARSVRV